MRPHRLAATALPVLAVVLSTLTACGSTGTNGVATKPVDQIIHTAKDTVERASTVHVTGDLGQGPSTSLWTCAWPAARAPPEPS